MNVDVVTITTNMRAFTVVVFGPVGVGKSTVVDAFDDESSGLFNVAEPTDAMMRYGTLDDCYANHKSSGLRMQMLVLGERFATYWGVASRIANAHLPPGTTPIVVCDGYIALDRDIFVDEHKIRERMTSADVVQYLAAACVVCAQVPEFMRHPNLYVYLRANPDTCLARARTRARDAEHTLDRNFFVRIVDACETLAKRLNAEQTLDQTLIVVDTDAMSMADVADAVRHTIATHVAAINHTSHD